MSRKGYVLFVVLFTSILSITPVVALPNRVNQTFDLWSFIQPLLSDPRNLSIFATQMILGLGLGYFSGKAAKYLLALIGILILGFYMNLWQLDALRSVLSSYGLSPEKMYSLILTIVTIVGITTIFPLAVGFIIGAIIAMRK